MSEINLPPFKLSVSKADTFVQCKKKYNYVYNMHLPRAEMIYHVFGKFLHEVLEKFHLIYMDGCQDPHNVVMSKVYKETLPLYKDKLTPETKAEAYEIVKQYLITLAKNADKPQPKIIGCEKKFKVNITDNVILNGAIDRIQIDPDNIVHVVDYKTSKSKQFLKDKFTQLLTYAYVLNKENSDLTTIRGSYVMLKHKFEYITKEFHIDEILSIGDKYLKYAQDIESEVVYPANPSILCSYCEFLNLCEEGYEKVGFRQLASQTTSGEVSW